MLQCHYKIFIHGKSLWLQSLTWIPCRLKSAQTCTLIQTWERRQPPASPPTSTYLHVSAPSEVGHREEKTGSSALLCPCRTESSPARERRMSAQTPTGESLLFLVLLLFYKLPLPPLNKHCTRGLAAKIPPMWSCRACALTSDDRLWTTPPPPSPPPPPPKWLIGSCVKHVQTGYMKLQTRHKWSSSFSKGSHICVNTLNHLFGNYKKNKNN